MGFSQRYMAAAPTASFGYYRGSVNSAPTTGKGYGPNMAGNNAFAQGQGPTADTAGWHPSILYLFGFIILEMIVFGILAQHL